MAEAHTNMPAAQIIGRAVPCTAIQTLNAAACFLLRDMLRGDMAPLAGICNLKLKPVAKLLGTILHLY